MRIGGLIRVYNSVRAQLQAGIRREAVESFRTRVTGIVGQVEKICEQHGQTPDRLPAPSRNAYFFLKRLDLHDLPVGNLDGPVSPIGKLRIKNLLSLGEHFTAQFWRHATASAGIGDGIEEALEEIRHQVAVIERICAGRHATPSILELPSRQVFCWPKFLSDEGNLDLHLEGLRSAHRALEEIGSSFDHPAQVHLVNMTNSLWRKRSYRNAWLLKVSEGFLNAGQDVCRALLHTARSSATHVMIDWFANTATPRNTVKCSATWNLWSSQTSLPPADIGPIVSSVAQSNKTMDCSESPNAVCAALTKFFTSRSTPGRPSISEGASFKRLITRGRRWFDPAAGSGV